MGHTGRHRAEACPDVSQTFPSLGGRAERVSMWIGRRRALLLAGRSPVNSGEILVRCTHSGAEKPSKKTSLSAQNPESKRSGNFLPSRSMVLMIVTGKI